MTARRVLFNGLARDADIFELVSELAPCTRGTTVAYIRAAASRAGIAMRQACQDLGEGPGHHAP